MGPLEAHFCFEPVEGHFSFVGPFGGPFSPKPVGGPNAFFGPLGARFKTEAHWGPDIHFWPISYRPKLTQTEAHQAQLKPKPPTAQTTSTRDPQT